VSTQETKKKSRPLARIYIEVRFSCQWKGAIVLATAGGAGRPAPVQVPPSAARRAVPGASGLNA
jgi:hypothetical protein